MRHLLVICLFIILLTGCKGSGIGGSYSQNPNIDLIARDYFEGSYAVKTNESGTYSIIYKNYKKLNELLPDVHYIVVDNSTNQVIFKDELKAGNINWYSDTEFVAIERNLEVKKEEDTGRRKYFYNVITNQKKIVDY